MQEETAEQRRGTPQGVGVGLSPPVFLKKDDVIEITIDPIGTLKNIVK